MFIVVSAANLSIENDQDEKEQEICLSSFDDYYDLLLKINPRFAKVPFILAFIFVHGDPLTGNLLFQHNEIQMEVLLVNVRSSIGVYGTDCFLKLLDILCNQEPYKEIGFHMLGMTLVYVMWVMLNSTLASYVVILQFYFLFYKPGAVS